MREKRNVICVITFLVFLGWMFFSCIFLPKATYSYSERRSLATMPTFTGKHILDGSFMTKFEKYSLDHYPFREKFRGIKAIANRYVFAKKENNGVYLADGYVSSMEYPINMSSLLHAGKKFRYIYETYAKEKSGEIYLALIPDKNYFLAEKSGILSLDYNLFAQKMRQEMEYATYIDLYDSLELEDYYRTDTHWKQERLMEVAKRLATGMGVELETEWEKKSLETPFYGVYYGQLSLPMEPDQISYLNNPTLEQCVVYDYEHQKKGNIYDFQKAEGKDPYEFFMSGPISLLEVENPKAKEKKELIVFRDSFASSLMPLFVSGYSKITMVDIRYIQSQSLGTYIDFAGKDILFLYSTMVLNHSETIK